MTTSKLSACSSKGSITCFTWSALTQRITPESTQLTSNRVRALGSLAHPSTHKICPIHQSVNSVHTSDGSSPTITTSPDLADRKTGDSPTRRTMVLCSTLKQHKCTNRGFELGQRPTSISTFCLATTGISAMNRSTEPPAQDSR